MTEHGGCGGMACISSREQAEYIGQQLVAEFGGQAQIAHHGDHWHVRQIEEVRNHSEDQASPADQDASHALNRLGRRKLALGLGLLRSWTTQYPHR